MAVRRAFNSSCAYPSIAQAILRVGAVAHGVLGVIVPPRERHFLLLGHRRICRQPFDGRFCLGAELDYPQRDGCMKP
jgi:hypothetical protein